MLVAEINGKTVLEAQSSEDYLTSAIFGHLRYVHPSTFWSELFRHTKSCDGDTRSFAERLIDRGLSVHNYTRLTVRFWPKHASFGEPDLVLRFEGGDQVPLNAIVEAKLYSGKSGHGEHDQLGRYAQIMDDLNAVGIDAAPSDHKVLLYLTARDSSKDIAESLETPQMTEKSDRLFRLQWQDVLNACREVLKSNNVNGHDLLVLEDVSRFLVRRGLEYFDGFKTSPIPLGQILARRLYVDPFGRNTLLSHIAPKHGGWIS